MSVLAFFNPFASSLEQKNIATQEVNNNILNSSNASCDASCSVFSGGTTIIIDGTTISGSVNFDQQCTVTQQCTITNSIDSQVDTLISSISDQSSILSRGLFDIWGGAQTNLNNVKQTLTTNLSNFVNSTCNSTANIVANDTFIYLNNSSVGGDINYKQSANVVSDCTINNMSRVQVSNSLAAQNKQSATQIGTTSFIIIFIIIALIIAALFIITKLFKGGGGGGTQKIEISPAFAEAAAGAAESGAV